MVNDEEAPTGRPAGAIGWAGLANCFYWIDRKNGLGGYWATQILPFADPTSFGGYMDFETAAYAARRARAAEGRAGEQVALDGPPAQSCVSALSRLLCQRGFQSGRNT